MHKSAVGILSLYSSLNVHNFLNPFYFMSSRHGTHPQAVEGSVNCCQLPTTDVELRHKGFPRSKNPGLRGNYLQALHYKGRLADPSESALEVASSGKRRKDTVRKDTVRSAPSVQWSKDVSYAQVLTGERSTTESQ
jgi:hypothetical protein